MISTLTLTDAKLRTGPDHRETSGDHQVAVFRLPTDHDDLLRELRRELGLNPVDGRIQIHHLPGVLPEHLPRAAAERVATAIRSVGGDAATLSADTRPELNRAPTVHHVRCTACGLEIVSLDGNTQLIPWDRLRLISVADVPLDGVRHFVAPRTAVIRATPRIKEARLTTRTLRGAEMWIVCEGPFQAFHIDHREMNYEYLGPRLSSSAAVNFRLLLDDLVEHAPHARLTPTTHAFREHASADQCRYASAEDHRKAVELAVIRERTHKESGTQPHRDPSASLETTMKTSTDTTSASGLREAHAALHREIDDMRLWCREAEEIGQPRFGQLAIRLTALRDHVAEHFAQEERGGYMAAVVAIDPRFAPPVEELQAEHARILKWFDDVAARLAESPGRYGCWSEGQHDLSAILADLERHEHAENALWQSAFEDDVGGRG